jgi:hypothetical protein
MPLQLEGWRLAINKKIQNDPSKRLMHILSDTIGPIYLEAVWRGLAGGAKRTYVAMLDDSEGELVEEDGEGLDEPTLDDHLHDVLAELAPGDGGAEEYPGHDPPSEPEPAIAVDAPFAEPGAANLTGTQFRFIRALAYAEALDHPCLSRLLALQQECCPGLRLSAAQSEALEARRQQYTQQEQVDIITEFLRDENIIDGDNLLVPASASEAKPPDTGLDGDFEEDDLVIDSAPEVGWAP